MIKSKHLHFAQLSITLYLLWSFGSRCSLSNFSMSPASLIYDILISMVPCQVCRYGTGLAHFLCSKQDQIEPLWDLQIPAKIAPSRVLFESTEMTVTVALTAVFVRPTNPM